MGGIGILLSAVLLAIMLTDHRVNSRSTAGVPVISYDEVRLTASTPFSLEEVIYGRYYYHGGTVKIPSRLCCLTFKQFNEECDLVPTFTRGCICNVVYQSPHCTSTSTIKKRSFAQAVQEANGSAIVLTSDDAERDAGNIYEGNPSLSIPSIFVDTSESGIFYSTLKDEDNVTVRIEVPGDPNDDGRNGFDNGRSATTFYFVVFAFTILLLLSLTWFVFNYLRRCHHMYTTKRQRAEMLSKTRRAIDKCPTKTYKKMRKASQKNASKDDVDARSVASEEEERCPICLESFKMKDVLRVLPCHHEFHKSCIDPWLYEKGTCPMCKLNIVGNQDECNGEQAPQDFRIAPLPISMEAVLGIAAESDRNDADQPPVMRRVNQETLQVENIE